MSTPKPSVWNTPATSSSAMEKAVSGSGTGSPWLKKSFADAIKADRMDLDSRSQPMSRVVSDTPPINIVAPAPIRMSDSVTLHNAGLLAEKLDHEKVKSKAARRKRNKKRAMKPGAPATTTVRGFQTPVTSCGEESDLSRTGTPVTPSLQRLGFDLDDSSARSSPALRPTSRSGGVSALTLQMERSRLSSPIPDRPTSLLGLRELAPVSSNASIVSEATTCDSSRTETESYQMNFEDDFASPDAQGKSSSALWEGSRHPSMTRKMTSDDFETLSCLGKGSYGTVHLVKQRCTGRLFAQKQFRKASLTIHKKLVEQTKTERAILESVNRHPFIVNLFYAFQDHRKLYLILEYAQGGELFHHLAMERMFSEDVAAFYMAELILALDYLHNTVGIIYRDLKPENCLLNAEGHLLLTDFGLSKVSAADENDRCSSIAGTIEYMAPEVVQGVKYGPSVDWWSLGALGFDLLTGSSPFRGNNYAKTQEKILKAKLVMPYFLSPDAKDLLTRLLRKDPSKRLGTQMPRDLQKLKTHRFFRKLDWNQLAKRECEPPIQPLITDPELAENFSTEFTELPLSPVLTKSGGLADAMDGADDVRIGKEDDCAIVDGSGTVDGDNPFGGFSYVASSSLFESSGGWFD